MTIVFQPSGKRADPVPDATLLDLAQNAGVDLAAACGGIGVCGDCRVRIVGGDMSALSFLEENHLTSKEIRDGMRLACQVEALSDDAVIEVPPESLRVAQRILLDGDSASINTDSVSQMAVHDLKAIPATTDDLRGDWERLIGWPPDCLVPEPDVLSALPTILRSHDWGVRLITKGRRPVAFLAPNEGPLGLAIDVGTTSLAVYLVDLLSGDVLAADGVTNPQVSYGEDVMARLTTVGHSASKARMMQNVVIAALNDLTQSLCEKMGTGPHQVVDVVVAGNTAMHHLLLGLPVEQLGEAPYVPVAGTALNGGATAIGLRVAAGARLYVPPVVAGFVGADHIAMLLATAMDQPGPITLALDIGTNTEISLRVGDQLLACSAASGPAFEGAHIDDGMRAGSGAIERVSWDHIQNRLRWLTVENTPPVGICGSGLIDLVAVLRQQEFINTVGAFQPNAPNYVTANGDIPALEIVPASQTGHERAIRISRADLSEVQMAKSAIRAGIKLLTEQAGVTEADIAQVIVAGAFGSYINIANAIEIGLLPPLPMRVFSQVGNAAGAGARALLMDAPARERAERLARHITYVELTTQPDFADRFSQAILLTPDPWE